MPNSRMSSSSTVTVSAAACSPGPGAHDLSDRVQSLIALAELLVRLPAAMLRCVGGARRRPWIVSGARAGRQGRAGTAVTTLRGPVAAAPDATVSVLGVPIDNVTMDAACERIGAAAAAGRPHCVVFVNADCVNLAYRDPGYKAILHHADLVLPDGVGLKLGARLLEQHIRQNVNGTDLFPRLCATLARQRSRVYLLGARPGVADQVACWIRARYPGLVVAGTDHGYHGPDCTDALVTRIRRARCQVLLVAFGAPHQER